MKHYTKLSMMLLLVSASMKLISQENIEANPGVERWSIKTSIDLSKRVQKADIKELLTLSLLAKEYSEAAYKDKLIPVNVNPKFKEGDIISTEGYLELIALEKDSKNKKDGDYHIQIVTSPDSRDSCLIVEIPYAEFVKDKELKSLCEEGRKFIRERFLQGKEPSVTGNVMQHRVRVKITGQLFYDASHAGQMRHEESSKNRYRGKKGVHSYTAWKYIL